MHPVKKGEITGHLPEKVACKIAVELLAIAHDRGCERELADALDKVLDQGPLPDPVVLRHLFGLGSEDLPTVVVLPIALQTKSTDAHMINKGRQRP